MHSRSYTQIYGIISRAASLDSIQQKKKYIDNYTCFYDAPPNGLPAIDTVYVYIYLCSQLYYVRAEENRSWPGHPMWGPKETQTPGRRRINIKQLDSTP